MTLTEFLLARRTEATEHRIIADAAWEATQMRLRGEQILKWMRWYDRSLKAQGERARTALGNVGWALLSSVWPARARREAARFADHPDFDPAWR